MKEKKDFGWYKEYKSHDIGRNETEDVLLIEDNATDDDEKETLKN